MKTNGLQGAQYSSWLEQLAITEPNLSNAQPRFILADVDGDLTRAARTANSAARSAMPLLNQVDKLFV